MLCVILLLRRQKVLPGQHFHIYLMAYGVFRFAHEFVRDTPRILGPISGYQIAALGVAILGAIGFFLRQRQSRRPEPSVPIVAIQKEELI
jgi:phosphatidylglycerol:prolipoprotein diacylglycerol transferase